MKETFASLRKDPLGMTGLILVVVIQRFRLAVGTARSIGS
jgi:hypothetical protein